MIKTVYEKIIPLPTQQLTQFESANYPADILTPYNFKKFLKNVLTKHMKCAIIDFKG